MNISEDEIKKFLERLLPLQESEQQTLCPRCGLHELYTGRYFFLNSLKVLFLKLIEPICSCIYLRKVLDGRSVAGNRPPADPAEAMERSIPLGFKRRITVICGAD